MNKITLTHCVAVRMSNLLKEKSWTKYKLFIESGVPTQTLSNLYNERTKSCDLETVYFIAKGFGMTLSEFFDDPIFNKVNIEK